MVTAPPGSWAPAANRMHTDPYRNQFRWIVIPDRVLLLFWSRMQWPFRHACSAVDDGFGFPVPPGAAPGPVHPGVVGELPVESVPVDQVAGAAHHLETVVMAPVGGGGPGLV